MTRAPALLLLLLAPLSAADPAPATLQNPELKRRAGHVIIISEDGLRPDALDGVSTPAHLLLLHEGSHALHARTIRRASTLPSHAAMLSGVDQRQHGLSWNSWQPSKGYIRVPSIFTDAAAHGLRSAVFVGKRKLEHITPPGSVEIFERPGYLCKKVVEEAARYFVEKKPDLMFVHFSDPDEYGHSEGWMSDRYERGVVQADRCLGKLLDSLRTARLLDSTLIILSADHGGHNHTHSGALPEDRSIPWLAMGPGVRKNYAIGVPVSTMDTAATALYALGLPIRAEIEGRPVKEIFLR